ncbi:hypothetical protein BsWGS_00165 [Bradybaena similaris]
MELFCCPYHTNSYCMVKTGTKPGPTKDASFYVCGQCKFSTHTKLPPVYCSIHKTFIVELQSFVIASKSQEQLRHYFRCPGRNAGESWCGYDTVSKKDAKVLKDYKEDTPGTLDVEEKQCTLQKDKECTAEADRQITSSSNKATAKCDSTKIDNCSKDKSERQDKDENNSVIVIDDEYDELKQVPVKEKSSDSSMEISFANLSKSRPPSTIESQDMSIRFDNNSFRQYRESPHALLKNKAAHSSLKPTTVVRDSEESSEDSDLEDLGNRKELEKLKISDKETASGATVNVKQDLHLMEQKAEKSPVSRSDTCRASKTGLMKEGSPPNVCRDELANKKDSEDKSIDIASKHSESGVVKPEVTYTREGLRSLICERETLTSDLLRIQSNLRSINISTLPDRGQRILDKIKSMKDTIHTVEEEIKKAQSGLGMQAHLVESNSTTKCVSGGVSQTNNSHSASSQQRPVHGTSKFVNPVIPVAAATMADSKIYNNNNSTDKLQVNAAPQPQFVADFSHHPQYLQELFASNPQAMTLYGGRMTAQRLREVGSITTDAIDKLHKQLESCPTEQTECPDPHGLKVTLKPHQRQALAWLAWREKQVPPGGILADDMGLGKTLTTISHIISHKVARSEGSKDDWLSRDKQVEKLEKAVKKSGSTLIVAPASLVHQWAKEIERRCKPGLLKFIVYHGPNRERNIQKLIDSDVVLTTYSIVGKEVGSDDTQNAEDPVKDGDEEEETTDNKKPEELPILLRIGWERIVLDEGHNIKNHKSLTAKSVCRLRAVYRWVLTGTPIQNDLLDMYSLLRFLRFSPFDEYKVWKKHIDSRRGDTKRLNTIVKALLLRRTKEQTNIEGKPLVSLPSKTSRTIHVEMTSEEKIVYNKLFMKTRSTVLEYVHRHQEKEAEVAGGLRPAAVGPKPDVSLPSSSNAGSTCVSHDLDVARTQGRSSGSTILVSLLRVRQCCSHLSLLKSHLDAASVESDGIDLTLEEQLKGMVLDDIEKDSKLTGSVDSATLFHKSSLSGKLKCVMDMVSSIQRGGGSTTNDKSVIVSQWTQMLEVVAHHLHKAGIPYHVIQGDIPPKKRMDIVDDFNINSQGPPVLLLSLQAGGVGLNLIGGNHLFLLDIHWNPALEEQACDRIYRMGQSKNVFIYRFLCKDTIEEKIVALQDRKRSLAKSVLSGTGASNQQKLSLADLRLLFQV